MKKLLLATAAGSLMIAGLAIPAQAAGNDPSPHLLKDINPGGSSSSLKNAVAFGSTMVFNADDGVHGDEPWISDGTSSGTKLLKNIAAGSAESDSSGFTAFNGKIYFEANDLAHGSELWVTDGTASGTKLLKDINVTHPSVDSDSDPGSFTAVGNTLYFTADDGVHGEQLWTTNGTSGGTKRISSIGPAAHVAQLTRLGSKLVFVADDTDPSPTDEHGRELWISDGTSSGTKLLKDIRTGPMSSSPDRLTASGPRVYFQADDGSDGGEPWVTNGTSSGTAELRDIYPGNTGSSPTFFPYAGGVVFRAGDPVDGFELWASNGTSAGTVEVSDINPGAANSSPTDFTAFKGAVYFSAKTAATGFELWVTKGTGASTHLVAELNGGPTSGYEGYLTAVGPLLLFTGQTPFSGTELFQSDGTSSGTVMVKDIIGGSTGSNPGFLAVVGNTLFFDATTNNEGDEPWAYTTLPSTTKAYPKSSYSSSTNKAKKISVTVHVRASGTTPTGRVYLKKGGVTIGSAALKKGNASVRITVKLAKGKTSLTAEYHGSVKAQVSTSSTFTVKVS